MKENKIVEEKDKLLLMSERLMLVLLLILFVLFCYLVTISNLSEIYQTLIILGSLIPFIGICLFCLKIEQSVGYYKCKHCNHLHVPEYKKVLVAMHVGWNRYLKCPKCNKYSLNKKVISEYEE